MIRAIPVKRGFVHCLTSLLLGLAVHSAIGQDMEFVLPASKAEQEWICRYTVEQDGAWYMRCEDLFSVQHDDPVLNDGHQAPQATLIPLWGAPYEDSPTRELAKAVLCRAPITCHVVVASI